jgi:hypothetical protein
MNKSCHYSTMAAYPCQSLADHGGDFDGVEVVAANGEMTISTASSAV